jgi:hypothetical protein
MPSEAETKSWPLAGYAPGSYHCKCFKCGEIFEGDKRAVECLPCAAKSVNAALSAASAVRSEPVVELRMSPISEGLPVRDKLRGEQTVLTYCEPVGTWNLVFFDSGEGEFDDGFRLGVTHWIDITEMWPGVIAQVAAPPVQTREDALEKALRRIAEGNLGDAPWQANYDKIRAVAREALSQPEPKGDKT